MSETEFISLSETEAEAIKKELGEILKRAEGIHEAIEKGDGEGYTSKAIRAIGNKLIHLADEVKEGYYSRK